MGSVNSAKGTLRPRAWTAAFVVSAAAAVGRSQPLPDPKGADAVLPAEPAPSLAASPELPLSAEGFRVFRDGLLLDAVRSEAIDDPKPGEPAPVALNPVRPGLRNSNKPLLRKCLRGEIIIGGVEVIDLGLLLVLPRSFSRWPEHPFSDASAHLKRAWTQPPVWDKDAPFHNYVGHPYAGSVYYNMLRSQDATPLQSFLFSTLQSVLYEYVIEAVAEQPSKQDLLITSTVGSILGELVHRWTLTMVRKNLNFWEKAIVFLLNPSYVVNNGFRAP